MTDLSNEYILVLNAAEGEIQCLLAGKGNAGAPFEIKAFQEWHAPSQGAELLAPALENMLARLCVSSGQIGRLAVVRGPGGFTGLRLVLATAAGFSRATGAVQAGLDYLPLLARGVAAYVRQFAGTGQGLLAYGEALFWAVTYARRNLVYAQAFRCASADYFDSASSGVSSLFPVPHVTEATPVLVVELSDLAAHIAKQGGIPILAGSGVLRNAPMLQEELRQQGVDALLMGSPFSRPGPEMLLAAAVEASYGKKDIQPLYVRVSDAEENLPHIASTLDHDPQKAQEALKSLQSSIIIIHQDGAGE